jgi:hypothetical protein
MIRPRPFTGFKITKSSASFCSNCSCFMLLIYILSQLWNQWRYPFSYFASQRIVLYTCFTNNTASRSFWISNFPCYFVITNRYPSFSFIKLKRHHDDVFLPKRPRKTITDDIFEYLTHWCDRSIRLCAINVPTGLVFVHSTVFVMLMHEW